MIDHGKRGKECLSLRLATEQPEAGQYPAEPQIIMVALPEPELFSSRPVCRWADGQPCSLGLLAQAVEPKHALERSKDMRLELGIGTKYLYLGLVQDRRIGIEPARLTQREQPLNIIVACLELLIIPGQDIVDPRPAVGLWLCHTLSVYPWMALSPLCEACCP